MTKLSHAMEIAGKWLDLDGVDMIIPRPETNEVVVVIIGCHADNLKNSIPASIKGVPVKICFVKERAA